MPLRREKARARRLNDRVIVELRELIQAGIPWNGAAERPKGFSDVYGLVKGRFYFPDYCDRNDEDSQRELWEQLKDDILAEHIKHEPVTRPWAWWKWNAPEPRRVIGRDCLDPDHDEDYDGEHGEHRLPAAEDPNLPQWAKKPFFGKPSAYDSYIYEDQYDYLVRLDLLFPEERAIFEKYGRHRPQRQM